MQDPTIKTFKFYDTETSGTDAGFDQIYQFASISTDQFLNVINGSETNIICRPRLDVVPHPMAFLTHMLDVDVLKGSGMNEFALAKMVSNIFTDDESVAISGYNNISFDNNFVRNLFFRNMKPIYDHEWKNGNISFDVFKLVQLLQTFKPDLVNWVLRDDGERSLKLSDMAIANGIEHINAHDALDDVRATIGVAQLIRRRAPRIFNYALKMTSKKNVLSIISQRKPLLHVDSVYGRSKNFTSVIYPMSIDPNNSNKYLCLDLRYDPRVMLEMTAEDIHKYIFTKRAELPADFPKMPITTVAINRQPLVAETTLITNDYLHRSSINIDECWKHLDFILNDNIKDALAAKMKEAMSPEFDPPLDAYGSIYSGGFIHDDDARLRSSMHSIGKSGSQKYVIEQTEVHSTALGMFDGKRHFDLILRAKWNSFYDSLLMSDDFSASELYMWVDYLEKRLLTGIGDKLTIDGFHKAVAQVELEVVLDEDKRNILNKLKSHVADVEKALENLKGLILLPEFQEKLMQEREKNPLIERAGLHFGLPSINTERAIGADQDPSTMEIQNQEDLSCSP